jgi:hypothetical protein
MPKFPSNRNFQALQIRYLIDPILSCWKALAINSLFDSNSAQAILRTSIYEEIDPAYLWTPSTSGKIFVSSAYNFITDSSPNISFPSIRPQFSNSL